MIRFLAAASLTLATGAAFAQGVPTSHAGTAPVAAASRGFASDPARPALRRDVETTGTVVPRAAPQRVMGLPVPGSY
ncbi:hypothetical protein [Methylobacterium sp. J-076]|uniref:hypothetical protein n=1 Tax=Methylobacterium sp. J-076 TaxID=2836655 RepID=UPI001FB95DB3|nr:hypothetical protein [Methylobacterium sp. J-076]MCJ2013881.1 hypothetical protein [Methylobacterium sp. J-076]